MARLRGAVASAAALAFGLGLTAAWADPAPNADAAAAPAQAAQPAAVDAIVSGTRQRLSSLSVTAAEREDLAALSAFYAGRSTPLWTAGTGFSAKGQEVLAEIAKADDWGLKASAFTLPSLAAGATPEAVADAEAKLGLAVLKYARHARGGRLDPAKLSKYIDVKPVPADPKAGMVSFEAVAGSVIVMHGRTWHTSGANTSVDRERVMLFALYARAFLRLQANWWQVLPPDVLDALGPELRLRLGLTWPNRGYGSYLVHTNPQPVLGGG